MAIRCWQSRQAKLAGIFGGKPVSPHTLRILMSYELKYLAVRSKRGDAAAEKLFQSRLLEFRCFGLLFHITGNRDLKPCEIAERVGVATGSVWFYAERAEEYFMRVLCGEYRVR